MQDLKVAIIQTEIFWEDIPRNILHFDEKISLIKEQLDLIILPEMFSTGFSMNASVCSETSDGTAVKWMKKTAEERNCMLAGSLLINENNKYYNRFIFMMPDGNYSYYDKRHLFRFASEHEVFSSGNKKITASFKGWNFCPLICYDLRFPIWSKNTYKNGSFKYDCLIYVANWPEKRKNAWMSLLVARAIENQAYVIGVNRIGIDGKGFLYTGDSMIIDPTGKIILQAPPNKDFTGISVLSYSEMQLFRNNFCVWSDWDNFTIDE